MVKYFNKYDFDDQGRICLGKNLIEPRSKVYVYVESPDFDIVHVCLYTGNENVPEYAIKTLDSKCRCILLAGIRGDAKSAFVGLDDNGGIVLHLNHE